MWEEQLMKILGFIFSGDQEKIDPQLVFLSVPSTFLFRFFIATIKNLKIILFYMTAKIITRKKNTEIVKEE